MGESQVLIIVPDPSSGGLIRRQLKEEGRANTALFDCWEDFTYGPLVPTKTPEKLLRLRHRHWIRLESGVQRPPERPALSWLLDRADRVEIMLGGTGREQLFLLGLSSMLGQPIDRGAGIELFQFPVPTHRHSLGMNVGELSEPPRPLIIDPRLLARLDEHWHSVTSNMPHALVEGMQKDDEPGLPYLKRGFASLLSSFPSSETGLGAAEDSLLRALSKDWIAVARVVGTAMLDVLDRHHTVIGDQILFARLSGMADPNLPHPAVELRGDPREPRRREVRITDFGLACLKGQENYVDHNGIDAWVGGVHLSSANGNMWFRDPDGNVVAK